MRGAILTQTLADGLRDLLGHAYGDMYAANTRRKQQQPAVTNPGKELPYPEAELLKEMQISVNNGNILAQSNDRHNTYAWKDDDISYDLHKTVTLGLTPLPGTNRYQVEGRIATSMRRQRPVFLLTSEAEAFTTARIHGWLELTMPDADADRGEVKPTLQLVFDPPEQTTRNNKSFISQIGQVNTDWDQRLVSGYAGDNHAAIDRMLVDLVNQIELSLNNFAIVPPGEDALTFRLPRFSPSGDLLLDINYKGVRPQTAQ